jgi:hypothetical protein
MKLDRMALRLLKSACDAAVLAPGDAKAHQIFVAWALLVGRIVGLPIERCHEKDITGRARWVRATTGALVAAAIANYSAGVWLNPSEPQNPAPSRAAIGPFMAVATSTDTGTSPYFWNTVTGKEFLGLPPVPRKPTTTIRDT